MAEKRKVTTVDETVKEFNETLEHGGDYLQHLRRLNTDLKNLKGDSSENELVTGLNNVLKRKHEIVANLQEIINATTELQNHMERLEVVVMRQTVERDSGIDSETFNNTLSGIQDTNPHTHSGIMESVEEGRGEASMC